MNDRNLLRWHNPLQSDDELGHTTGMVRGAVACTPIPMSVSHQLGQSGPEAPCLLSGSPPSYDGDCNCEGFGCRQAYENRPSTNPRAAVMVYGDFEFCSVEVIAEPARRWRWRRLGE
jgi:hypothetical protein